MALSHGDHKRIAASIAREMQRVLHAHNGDRLMARHHSSKAEIPPDPVDEDEMKAALEGEEIGEVGDDNEPAEAASIETRIKKHRPFGVKKG